MLSSKAFRTSFVLLPYFLLRTFIKCSRQLMWKISSPVAYLEVLKKGFVRSSISETSLDATETDVFFSPINQLRPCDESKSIELIIHLRFDFKGWLGSWYKITQELLNTTKIIHIYYWEWQRTSLAILPNAIFLFSDLLYGIFFIFSTGRGWTWILFLFSLIFSQNVATVTARLLQPPPYGGPPVSIA